MGAFVLVLFVFSARPVSAAGIVVNSAADTVADDGFCTLREAITAANTDTASGAAVGECAVGSGADEITFAGHYTITLDGSQLPVVTSVITVTGTGATNTIIQANANPNTATYRVFEVAGGGNLTLDGVTVRHGRCEGACLSGGGILNFGMLTVTNSTVSGNRARTSGGGIYSENGELTVTNSTLSGNAATTNSGGGIYSYFGTLNVTNSTLSGNSAGNRGGGISGGASVVDSLTVSNSTLSGNSAGNRGGGIDILNLTATVTNSTLSANLADNGGGINNDGYLTVTNSTLSANSATSRGGGIRNGAGEVTMTNSTLWGNSADDGGGIWALDAVVTNSLLVAGSAGENCSGGSTLGASNIADDIWCRATLKTADEIALGPLADNGGPTQTHALLPGSAAIDFNAEPCAVAADQRGVPRPQGTACDAGAFEVAETFCQAGYYFGGLYCLPADPGYYVDAAGAVEQTPCAPGTYQPNSGASSCIAAPPGSYVDTEGAIAPIDCALGTYQPSSGTSSCIAAPAGSYVDTEGATSATECPIGTFSSAAGATACAPAPAGSFVSVTGATSATECPAGKYQDLQGQTSCKDAEAGSFVANPGATEATLCDAGTYQPDTGQTSCLFAQPGYFVGSPGATVQTACPMGTYQPLQGDFECDQAEPGYFVDTVASATQTACAPGYYQPNIGASSCLAAPAGSFVSITGATSATECPAGKYQNLEGQTSCKDAQPGSFVSGTGATEATLCSPGTYQDEAGQTSCKDAEPGFYVPNSGATEQLACPAGTTSGVAATACTPITMNQPPTSDPGSPYLGAIKTAIQFNGSGSSDPDDDALTYAWDFGDGSVGSGVMPTHSYTAVGIYDVCLTVNDGTVDSAEVCTVAVVYDPAGGFVTGGGWIDSPAGAYTADPTLTGKATFGFVAKYKKGANTPDGNTQFQFKAGDLNFHSTSYDWLVVAGANAKFKGVGTINGSGAYTFMLTATDGDLSGGLEDSFRIKITGPGGVVYDNQMGAGDDSNDTTALGGGSIVIHKAK